MNKEEFLSSLRERLAVFPDAEIEEYINYYREMIDDRMEDGFTEEQVIQELGCVDDVFAVILQETALTQLLKKKMKPKHRLRPWEIVLLVLGSPIWIPLAAAAVVIVLAAYVVLWSLLISLYAIELSIAACGLGGCVSAVFPLLQSNGFAAGVLLCAGLVCAGIAILLFFPCKLAAKGAWKLSKTILLGIKFLIIGKEKAK